MDCPSCAGKIRGAVERLKGVSDVQVSVMKETLRLGLDTRQTSMEQVEKTVKRLGYGVQFKPAAAGQDSDPDESHSHGGCDGSQAHDHDHCHGHDYDHDHDHDHDHDRDVTMATAEEADTEGTLSWKVGGMDCASCAAKIRGGVENLPGVSDVKVSVMNETLTLKLDEQ
ncbi:cation transporter, partial [Salinicola sp. MIT1003]|uniref:cation transporter n=1 Tax=Salinicola sp. MIT1003 TaxID=1882734 RepID=UPI00147A1A2A